MATFYAIYIEQAAETRGLWKHLASSTDPAAIQAAIDAEWSSNGDTDPTHYLVIEVARNIALERKSAEPTFTVG